MKKTYKTPSTMVCKNKLRTLMTTASQNPDVSIGSGKRSTFDSRRRNSVWDEDEEEY